MFYQRFMQALLEIPVPNGCISELGDRTVKMRHQKKVLTNMSAILRFLLMSDHAPIMFLVS